MHSKRLCQSGRARDRLLLKGHPLEEGRPMIPDRWRTVNIFVIFIFLGLKIVTFLNVTATKAEVK